MVRLVGLLLWLSLLPFPALAEKREALLIGNETYSSEIGRLANPHNDVALLEQALKQDGFDVVIVHDAGLGALTRAVNAYVRRLQAAGPNAVGFFYYSGHGASDGTANYLIPVDAKTIEAGGLWDESLRLTEVTRKLKAEAGGQKDAQRRHHAHQLALLIGGFEDDHRETGVGAVLGDDALNQGALLTLRPGGRIAADLPVAVHGLDRALGVRRQRPQGQQRHGCQNRQPKSDNDTATDRHKGVGHAEVSLIRIAHQAKSPGRGLGKISGNTIDHIRGLFPDQARLTTD